MTLIEELIKILISDILIGLNLVVILYIILHFVKKYVLPQIPHWIKEYKQAMMELHALSKVVETREKYK